jgi:hypothetical protein
MRRKITFFQAPFPTAMTNMLISVAEANKKRIKPEGGQCFRQRVFSVSVISMAYFSTINLTIYYLLSGIL